MAECDMADEGVLFQTGLPMSFILRDATLSDIPAITAIYRESVLNGVASYEMTPPGEAEMESRFSVITGNGYPYIAAIDADGVLLGYAYASAFRTRTAYRFMVEDSIYLAPEARGRAWARRCLPS
jgi:L-amino acid N-acyltransferase YncA